MIPLKIPINYIKSSFETHIQNINKLQQSSVFKISNNRLNKFIDDVNSNNNLTDLNKHITIYGVLYTIECILTNQNISHPFGINSRNSVPLSTKTYEFDIKKGVYHSHILDDEETEQNIILIWYLLKEDEDIVEYTIKFRYMPHPSIPMYKSIIKDIENEEFTYHFDKKEYMIDTLFDSNIYRYNEFINKRGH